ncbi:MAG: phospholipase D-like domain-containing protein [Anaerolineaceae bacterium]|nr:phospholipase D-like domain-containing protein [Anaerolineaceae bacterium]
MSPRRKPTSFAQYLFLFVFLIFAALLSTYLGLNDRSPGGEAAVASPTAVAAEAGAAPIRVYFTDPYAPDAAQRSGSVDADMVRSIDQAQRSIDLAVYNFSLDSVAEALLRAQQRGVPVRMVMESTALDNRVPQALQDAGLPILGDRREGLMHDKFMVIDGVEVWTGSMNLTGTGVYNDHNNMVQLFSTQIAQDYTHEFEEMFVDDHFGSNSVASDTPYPSVNLNGRQVEVYFSPDDGVLQHLVALVAGAQSSIDFLAYSFTADELADAMIARAQAGVRVRGVMEDNQIESNQGTEFERLRQAGIPVYRDTLSGLMHHKVIVVDGQVVELGSYNYSASAESRNDENVMIVHDPQVAGQYTAEFERIFTRSSQ